MNAALRGYLLLAPNFSRRFILAQPKENRLSQFPVARPLRELTR
jgi:hypothetical protein